MGDREVRAFPVVELRVVKEKGRPEIAGYAAVFDSWTELGDFQEVVRPGAFARALAEGQDVRALVNHDPNQVIGRTKNGSLSLAEDEKGLRIVATPPDTQVGRDAVRMVEDGYMDSMSFAFRVPSRRGQRWSEDGRRRELLDVDLFDVSVVTYPAYKATSVSVRSAWNLDAARSAYRHETQLRRMEARMAAWEARHGK